jgi:DNA-binding PadR family transcriptional regulator
LDSSDVWCHEDMETTFAAQLAQLQGAPLGAPPTSTPEETRELFTRLAGRGYLKLRHVLVQLPDDRETRTSTVGTMLSQRKHRALLLYLLILTSWSWLSKRKAPLPAEAWIRALTAGPGVKKAPTWSASTLSRALGDLETMGLIEKRKRVRGRSLITPRREDGDEIYSIPEGRTDRYNTYFTLPDDFWTSGLFAKLSFPGLVMLLIIAKETSQKAEMYIPHEQGPDWYGISAGTVKNGLKNLDDHELLDQRDEWRKAPLSATGRTKRIWYSLTDEYSQGARERQRTKSKTERTQRINKTSTRLEFEELEAEEA